MYYKVLVYPGSPKDSVLPPEDLQGRYTIYTREPAQNNRANRSVIQLLANHLSLPLEKLRIVKGHHSPQKTILCIQ